MKEFKWLTISQSVAILGASLVFPFYILFIREFGTSFSQFGISYGLFTISAALVHKLIGRGADRFGRKLFLVVNSWGMAVIFLLFPIVTAIWHIYIIQIILGIFGAMQKTSEKSIVADFSDGARRGEKIGAYHGWLAIFSGVAIIIGGYIADLLTLEVIFYLGSIFMFISGLLVLKIDEKAI